MPSQFEIKCDRVRHPGWWEWNRLSDSYQIPNGKSSGVEWVNLLNSKKTLFWWEGFEISKTEAARISSRWRDCLNLQLCRIVINWRSNSKEKDNYARHGYHHVCIHHFPQGSGWAFRHTKFKLNKALNVWIIMTPTRVFWIGTTLPTMLRSY